MIPFAVLAGVFVLDVGSELGIATPCLYTIPVLLGLRLRDRQTVLATAIAGALLTLGGVVFSPTGGDVSSAWANRVIALGLLATAVVLGLRALHAERERSKVEQRMKTVVDSLMDAIVTIDGAGRVHEWNPQAENIFGWHAREAIGRDLADLIVPKEDRPAHRAGLARVAAGGDHRVIGRRLELTAIDRTGRRFPVELSITHDSSGGEHSSFVGCLRDITERKRAERAERAYASDLRRSNEDLDSFAYAASHDLKAPLRAVENLAIFIEEDVADLLPESSRKDLALLRARIGRMSDLLGSLLQYSRAGRVAHPVERIELESLLAGVLKMLGLPAAYSVQTSGLPVVHGERAPLEQVLSNLLVNAVRHHDRAEGTIEIGATWNEEWVEISVRDDGPGIDPGYHDKIFGLFQSLKPRDVVEGSGMGLALVKKIVERHGGSVRVESIPGEGATFSFSWPVDLRSGQEEEKKMEIA